MVLLEFFHRHRLLLNIAFGTNYFNCSSMKEREFSALFFKEEEFKKKKDMATYPDQ